MAEYRDKGIAALIFDFDGTLAVPTLDFSLMRREALRAMEEYVAVPDGAAGMPTMELLERLGTGTDAALLAREAALAAVRRVEIDAAGKSSLFPFVRPMLARLKETGLAMAIVTRNCPEAVAIVFPDAAGHGPVLTRDDVPRIKPDPAHCIAALRRLNIAPEHALMVGDHAMDVETGKRAKTLTAAVASGEHSLERLAAANPDYLAADGGELMRMLGIL